MTKTKVTPIIRMVFLFWLVVSIALVGTTIAMLPSPPDRRHERDKRESGLTVDIDFNSFDSTGATCSNRLWI
jgi:hypothetical protein